MYNVLEWLEESQEKYSDKIAVIDEMGAVTYDELVNVSKAIGSKLVAVTGMRKPIAVLADKGIDTLSTFFGIVYAGCFYVSFNPELPEVRLNQVQSVLNAEYIITDEEHLDRAKSLVSEDKILLIEDLKQASIDESALKDIRRKAIDIRFK